MKLFAATRSKRKFNNPASFNEKTRIADIRPSNAHLRE
jgi:hypothetical protein